MASCGLMVREDSTGRKEIVIGRGTKCFSIEVNAEVLIMIGWKYLVW